MTAGSERTAHAAKHDLIALIREALSAATDAQLAESALGRSLQQRLELATLQLGTRQTALLLRAGVALRLSQPRRAALLLLNCLVRIAKREQVLGLLHRAAKAQGDQQAADRIAAQLPPKDPERLDFSRKIDRKDLDAFLQHQETKRRQGAVQAAAVPPLPVITAAARDPLTQPVDVIIPVYGGYRETLGCLHSLLGARQANATAHELIVLNDASPEPELIRAIANLAGQGALTLIHHRINLGYIRGMNRAMALHQDRDLVWLNADTCVNGNWLDRLRAWAYREPKVASVTPLTNNGELMSFPEPLRPYAMPEGAALSALDGLAAQLPPADGIWPLEFGCGFCMYLRREAVFAVGYLDEAELEQGYGEETDWCLRASAQGWQHIAAPNVFVGHLGRVSFGEEKRRLVARNNAILRRRYPHAEGRFGRYLARDPLKPARQSLQRGRLAELRAWMQDAPGPEPRLGDARAHPRQLHIIPPPALDDPLSPFFVQPAADTGLRLPPPGLLWLSWRIEQSGLVLQLGAALSPLPLLRDASDAEQILAELRTLPLLGLVYHAPDRAPQRLRQCLGQLGLPYALRQMSLSAGAPAGFADFLKRAAEGRLPVTELLDDYRARFPEVRFRVDQASWAFASSSGAPATDARPSQTAEAVESPAFVVGDFLDKAPVAERWMALARRLGFSQPGALFALAHHSPWQALLWGTGRVLGLPILLGLEPDQIARLSGCRAVISLDAAPDASWTAPQLADRFGLPLLAPHSSFARAVGAGSLPQELQTILMSIPEHPSSAAEYPPQPGERKAATATAEQEILPAASANGSDAGRKPRWFLNLGCGRDNPNRLPEVLRADHWQQTRLDIDPSVAPDIIGSAHDLSAIIDGCFDAVWSSHSLEHLETHQVPHALAEIHRVLKPDGFALLTMPDLQAIADLVAAGRLTETAYDSPIGPITALDMLFGHERSLANGNSHMAHRTGFDSKRLGQSLLDAGFEEVRVRKGQCYDLWAYAYKQSKS